MYCIDCILSALKSDTLSITEKEELFDILTIILENKELTNAFLSDE